MDVPHAFIVRLPHTGARGVPLVHGVTIAVIEVDVGVGGARERAYLYPDYQLTGTVDVILDFMIELGGAVGGREENVSAVVLVHLPPAEYKIRIDGVDQHGEVCLIRGDLGGVDGDPLAVGPAIVEGVSASARCFLNSHGIEGGRRLLVVVLGGDPLRAQGAVVNADFIHLAQKIGGSNTSRHSYQWPSRICTAPGFGSVRVRYRSCKIAVDIYLDIGCHGIAYGHNMVPLTICKGSGGHQFVTRTIAVCE